MTETVEKKPPVRNLERVHETKFAVYEAAKKAKDIPLEETERDLQKNWNKMAKLAKVKIFARYDGTFDVVWYKKIEAKPEPKKAETKPEARPIHGQLSKERKRSPKRDR